MVIKANPTTEEATRSATNAESSLQDELGKRLQALVKTQGVEDGHEFVRKLTQEVYNALLEAEMRDHLGYAKHEPQRARDDAVAGTV